MIVRRLCVFLDAECVYREFSEVLKDEEDLDFASTMVQVLSIYHVLQAGGGDGDKKILTL